MRVRNFESELWLPQPRDKVFAFFSDAQNLESGVPEPGDRNSLFLVRRRRLGAGWRDQSKDEEKSERDAHAAVFH